MRPAFQAIAPMIAKFAPTSGVFSSRGSSQMATPRPAIGVQP